MAQETHSQYFTLRRERLLAQLEARKLAGLLVTNLTNIFYLTGFRGSAGVALIGPSRSVLWVDPRYTLQAREQAQGLEVREAKGILAEEAVRWIRRKRLHRVGYEDSTLTCREFSFLKREGGRELRWVPAGGVVEDLRVVKDAEEINSIRKACQLTAEVFEEVRQEIRPGIREGDLAAEIEYRIKRKGAEGLAFDTIVCSGKRSAWPHARPSAKLLEKSNLVIVDLGAILGGYAADMTRTVYLGTPGPRVRRLYDAVRDAQEQAVAAVRAGKRACDIDRVARKVLERRKLDNYFTHSTGHGVGLEIHERPRLGRSDKTRLEDGCVITVEPGVYLEGFGGVRVEDTVLVTAGMSEVLTPAAKDIWFTS
ncbi:MAG: Xaa-Pro peptidase family protein [Acidobacteria bacterium]|nr:Xaa-Pro peptidase family protein [Acidobacteriota bacterium]